MRIGVHRRRSAQDLPIILSDVNMPYYSLQSINYIIATPALSACFTASTSNLSTALRVSALHDPTQQARHRQGLLNVTWRLKPTLSAREARNGGQSKVTGEV